ncbi:hypothetical protein HJFPF1_02979 [Paramyrothecium foliicola]|nr:hypothetical protein HJFPF1_02979 [Paramyrothecium foliicola]
MATGTSLRLSTDSISMASSLDRERQVDHGILRELSPAPCDRGRQNEESDSPRSNIATVHSDDFQVAERLDNPIAAHQEADLSGFVSRENLSLPSTSSV